MGGHGGLNIIPQKSWNVYSAKNKAKVARDEQQQRNDSDRSSAAVSALRHQSSSSGAAAAGKLTRFNLFEKEEKLSIKMDRKRERDEERKGLPLGLPDEHQKMKKRKSNSERQLMIKDELDPLREMQIELKKERRERDLERKSAKKRSKRDHDHRR
jgi:hypothetical protein